MLWGLRADADLLQVERGSVGNRSMRSEMNLSYRPSFWARFFGGAKYQCAEICPEGVRVEESSGKLTFLMNQLDDVHASKGLFWGTIKIDCDSGSTYLINGIPKSKLSLYAQEILSKRKEFLEALGLIDQK